MVLETNDVKWKLELYLNSEKMTLVSSFDVIFFLGKSVKTRIKVLELSFQNNKLVVNLY